MADELKEAVCEVANALLDGKDHITLLEAGCGSASHVKFKANVYAVGIDISGQELERNVSVQEKILGDIQEYPLSEEHFDVAVCWMVLEHLPRPKDAMLNLFRTVKPGGIVILGFPNLLSFKGIVTKITPFWFHALFYRFMKYNSRHFPTYLRAAILPNRVKQLAEERGFSVELCRMVEGGVSKKVRGRFRSMDVAFSLINSVTQVLSFGKLQSLMLDNCAIIVRKPATKSADEIMPCLADKTSQFGFRV